MVLRELAQGANGNASSDLSVGFQSDTSTFQVRVVGYLKAALGIAEAARRIAQSVDKAGLSLCVFPYTATRSEALYDELYTVDERSPVDVNIICINADMIDGFAHMYPRTLDSAKRNVGVWFWELESFPDDLVSSASYLDEIWAGSEFIAASLRSKLKIPIRVIQIPMAITGFEGKSAGQRVDDTDRFRFLFAFDYASIFERKNPLGVVQAYHGAFSENDGVELVVKSINGYQDRLNRERLRLAVRSRPDVILIEEYLSHKDQEELFLRCDCYVLLHRSEGLGLTIAHAMALGKVVIATAYGGNLDFMGAESTYLVPYEMVRVGPGSAPYPPDSIWAEPDIGTASEYMRTVVMDRRASVARGQIAKESIDRLFNSQRCADEVRSWYQMTFLQSDETPEQRETEVAVEKEASLWRRALGRSSSSGPLRGK